MNINDKLNYLTITKIITNSKIECTCDCGNIINMTYNQFISSFFRSCGKCNKKKYPKQRKSNGYGEISSTLFQDYKRGASKRNIIFDVDAKYLWELFLSQNKKCPFTNIILCFSKQTSDYKSRTASLDRIDSTKGYIKGNLQWIYKPLNNMKMCMTDIEFKRLCVLVATPVIDEDNKNLNIQYKYELNNCYPTKYQSDLLYKQLLLDEQC